MSKQLVLLQGHFEWSDDLTPREDLATLCIEDAISEYEHKNHTRFNLISRESLDDPRARCTYVKIVGWVKNESKKKTL